MGIELGVATIIHDGINVSLEHVIPHVQCGFQCFLRMTDVHTAAFQYGG